MQRGADAGKTPSLINAQVGDDVRHPEAEVGVIDRQAVVVDDATVEAEEVGVMTSTVPPPLRVAGSSSDSVPEKPLPNWAV